MTAKEELEHYLGRELYFVEGEEGLHFEGRLYSNRGKNVKVMQLGRPIITEEDALALHKQLAKRDIEYNLLTELLYDYYELRGMREKLVLTEEEFERVFPLAVSEKASHAVAVFIKSDTVKSRGLKKIESDDVE